MLAKFSYQRTASIKEAAAAAGRPETRILAGGTDLLGCLRDGVFQANRLVSLNGIKELKGIRPRPGGGLRIGALTTLTEIAENRQILDYYPVLAQAAAAVGSPQLRNQGTLGGNLCQRPRCWYFRGDFHCLRKGGESALPRPARTNCTAFSADTSVSWCTPRTPRPRWWLSDAKVSVAGRQGTRANSAGILLRASQDKRVKENVLEPGDVVTEVLLDAPQSGARGTYRKARERASFDFALAGAAIVLTMAEGKVQTARVVLSGVAPVPWRSPEAEQALVGKPLDAATAEAAASGRGKSRRAARRERLQGAASPGHIGRDAARSGRVGAGHARPSFIYRSRSLRARPMGGVVVSIHAPLCRHCALASLTRKRTPRALAPSGSFTRTFCGPIGRISRSGPFIIIGLERLTR